MESRQKFAFDPLALISAHLLHSHPHTTAMQFKQLTVFVLLSCELLSNIFMLCRQLIYP